MRKGGAIVLVLVLLLLLMFGGGWGGEKPDDKDDGDDEDKNKPGGGDACPPGQIPNPAVTKLRKQLQAQGMGGLELLAALKNSGLPFCVDEGEEPKIPGGPTGPKGDPTEPKEPGIIPGVIIDVFDDPKPSDIDSLVKDYATPKTFHQVKAGEAWLGKGNIATRYASTALYWAAQRIGKLDDDAALEWASSGGRNALEAQRELTRMLACVPYNDARYGTFAIGPDAITNTEGRALVLHAINGPDRDRIREGQPATRNVPLGEPGDGPALSSHGVNGDLDALPLLWLPEIDLQVLWDSDGRTWRFAGKWNAGTSTIQPPPAIYALGIIDYSNAGDRVWGCAPWATKIG